MWLYMRLTKVAPTSARTRIRLQIFYGAKVIDRTMMVFAIDSTKTGPGPEHSLGDFYPIFSVLHLEYFPANRIVESPRRRQDAKIVCNVFI